MTREVLIAVSGVRLMDEDQEDVELIVRGNYYEKNGKHYIIYDEAAEDGGEKIRNTIKISSGRMDIIKRGTAKAHMVFEEGQKKVTGYQTLMGELMIGIRTAQIYVEHGEDVLEVRVNYSLDINCQHVADCQMKITARSLRAGSKFFEFGQIC